MDFETYKIVVCSIKEPSEIMLEVFSMYDISIKDSNGDTRDTYDIFYDINNTIQIMKNTSNEEFEYNVVGLLQSMGGIRNLDKLMKFFNLEKSL